MNDEAQEILDSLNAKLSKRYKNRAPVLTSGDSISDIEWIPTGLLAFDWINGGGGPRGRVEQLVGAKSSGKSSISLRRIAEGQRNGLTCAYVDVEHTLDKLWARKLGVDLNNLIMYSPEDYDSAEVTLEVVIDMLKLCSIDIIVIDSVTSLCPQAKIDGSMEDKHYAGVAGVLSQFFDKIIGPGVLYNSNTNLILINQPRDVIGSRFHMERIPGGKSLAHNSSIITYVKEGDFIFESNDKNASKIGKEIKVINNKNKCRFPYRESSVSLYFASGFNPLMDVLQFSEYYNLIEYSGAWGYYEGENIGQGKVQQSQWLLEHREVYGKLKEAIRQSIITGK